MKSYCRVGDFTSPLNVDTLLDMVDYLCAAGNFMFAVFFSTEGSSASAKYNLIVNRSMCWFNDKTYGTFFLYCNYILYIAPSFPPPFFYFFIVGHEINLRYLCTLYSFIYKLVVIYV